MKIALVEKPDYIYNYLKRYKEKLPFPYNELEKISVIKKASSYQFEGTKFRLIKYKGILKNKKSVCFYGYSTSPENKKLYNRWLFLTELYYNNFSSPPFLVSKPIFFSRRHNFLLYEESKGKTLFEYTKKNQLKNLREGIVKSAQWLLKFHNLKIKKREIFTLINEIEKKEFAHCLEVLRKFFPQIYYQKIKKILSKINNHTKLYLKNKNQISLVHGDFQPQNIVFNKKRGTLSVIDFDSSGIGDPLSDISNFLIQIDCHNVSFLKKQETIINLKKELLKNYFKNRFSKKTVERINLYQAKFAIQIAIFYTEFILSSVSRPWDNPAVKFLFKKAEKCYKEKDKINLEVYPYWRKKGEGIIKKRE